MVQSRTASNTRFRRDAWLEIDINKLEFNLKTLYSEFNKPLIPVLKADAYGHGADVLVKTLDAFDFVHGYGVASIDEALTLRESTSNRIIVLGVSPAWAISQAIEQNIELTLVDLESAKLMNTKAQDMNKTLAVHIKLDTGMNRIGFKDSASFEKQIKEIESLSNLEIKSLFTHFADPKNKDYSEKQKQGFEKMTSAFDYPVHPASSQALRVMPEMKADYVRCGIELFGLENPDLKPLMSLFARVSFVKAIKAGESVSYKTTWTSDKDTWIATLPLGYADGLQRSLSGKIRAYIPNKSFVNQVGLITMDQVMFEVDESVQVGDMLELLGEHIKIDEWCDVIGTISYEIASILNLRLPKVYTRN